MRRRRRPDADFRWTATLVLEQAAIVEEIARSSLSGSRVPNLLWHRATLLNDKARIREPAPPGPATYQAPQRAPPPRARSTMGLPPKDGVTYRIPGTTRIRVLPASPRLASPRSQARALKLELASRPRASVGPQVVSNAPSAPAWSIAGKPPTPPEERERRKLYATATGALVPASSSFGGQVLSTHVSAPCAVFSAGLSREQAQALEIRSRAFNPSPAAYGAPPLAGLSTVPTAPAVRLPGRPSANHSMAEFEAALKARRPVSSVPGPGAYSLPSSVGSLAGVMPLGDRSIHAARLGDRTLGEGTAAPGPLLQRDFMHRTHLSTYVEAHDRRQLLTPRATRRMRALDEPPPDP